MAEQKQFTEVFDRLKGLLTPIGGHVKVTQDSPNGYALDGPYMPKFKRDLNIGSVVPRKNYVSFYLMPVYMFPDLLEGISPELRKRMQGKSCFNFTRVDEDLLAELGELTEKSVVRLRSEGLL